MRWIVFPMIESWWPQSRVIRRRSSWPRVSTFICDRQVIASKHREANQIKQSRACTHALRCCGAMDITCIPMARGFVHLAAVVGWFTRRVLAAREIKISMDGKRAWRDNVFVERLWRTIKYEEVCLWVFVADGSVIS